MIKLTKVLIILNIIFFSNVALSNELSAVQIEQKKQEYNNLIDQQNEAEEKAKYNGHDEIVRKRVGLPPKLPSFEKWIENEILKDTTADGRHNQQSNTQYEDPNLRQVESKIENAESANVSERNDQSEEKSQILSTGSTTQSPKYPLTESELQIAWATFGIFLAVNFVLYNLLPRIRFILIATPFDLAANHGKSETEKSPKAKKYITELLLLILIIFWQYLTLESGRNQTAEYSQIELIEQTLINCIGIQLLYVITRLIVGWRTKCPKCKSTFAKKVINSYKDIHTSEEKYSASRGNYSVEKGVIVKDNLCSVCAHTWSTRKNYYTQ